MTATLHRIGTDRQPSLDSIINLVAAEMNHVNAVILERMQSQIPLIPELAGHLIAGGGKRMRPMLTLASARLLDYSGTRHHKLSAAVEFIHTATLLHDDVVDACCTGKDSTAQFRKIYIEVKIIDRHIICRDIEQSRTASYRASEVDRRLC